VEQSLANHCHGARVNNICLTIYCLSTLLEAVLAQLPELSVQLNAGRRSAAGRNGFHARGFIADSATLSGGQHTRCYCAGVDAQS
jgi:hypothetical protein